MLPFTKTEAKAASFARPNNAATTSTLTQVAADAIEANAYETFRALLAWKDAETGAKSVVFSFWTKDSADGTVGDGTWTAVVPDSVQLDGKSLTPTLAASAAFAGTYEIALPMRLFSKKYAAVKAVVTHPDPTASVLTHGALIASGELARRVE